MPTTIICTQTNEIVLSGFPSALRIIEVDSRPWYDRVNLYQITIDNALCRVSNELDTITRRGLHQVVDRDI